MTRISPLLYISHNYNNILSENVFSFMKNTYKYESFQTRNQKMARRSPTVTRPHNPPFKGKNRPLHQQNTLNRVPMQTGALILEHSTKSCTPFRRRMPYTHSKHVTCVNIFRLISRSLIFPDPFVLPFFSKLKISFVIARHMANILWLLAGNDTQMNDGASVRRDVPLAFFLPATMTVHQLFQRGKRQLAGLFNTRRRFRIEIAFSSVQCKINAPMLLTIRTSGC